jgi:LPS-assembly lipoprotein
LSKHPVSLIRAGLLRLLLLLVLATTVSACGFHLRGGVAMAPILEDTYIKSPEPYSGLSAVLRSELQSAGARLVSDPQQASAVIHIINSRSLRRVLSVGKSAKASEYELFEEVTFVLEDNQGSALLPTQTIKSVRDLVFDENELLGKVSEAEDIRRQMQRSLARQIITRIDFGMRQP